MPHILLRDLDIPDIGNIDVYTKNGGYEGLKKALGMAPDEETAVVKDSNLRGRGGAGFPTGLQGSFVPKSEGPTFVSANAHKSETTTLKDRQLFEKNPAQ